MEVNEAKAVVQRDILRKKRERITRLEIDKAKLLDRADQIDKTINKVMGQIEKTEARIKDLEGPAE